MTVTVTSLQTVRVWDIWVRLTHWAVAVGLFINLLVTEDGSDAHEYVGYAVMGLVVSRLIWGLIGSRYARFSDFFPTPARIKQHLDDVSEHRYAMHLGHNPLGALMMFALWGVIMGLGVTGYLQTTDHFWGDDWLQTLHKCLAYSLYGLVPMHVAAAIMMSRLQRQNLIKSMITGKKLVDNSFTPLE
ncbi:MAG: cytochrome b/b6 domain-containing protein [Moraxella sp.]|jgi:cytochrome b